MCEEVGQTRLPTLNLIVFERGLLWNYYNQCSFLSIHFEDFFRLDSKNWLENAVELVLLISQSLVDVEQFTSGFTTNAHWLRYWKGQSWKIQSVFITTSISWLIGSCDINSTYFQISLMFALHPFWTVPFALRHF